MAQPHSTSNVVPFGRRSPEVAERSAKDIPPVFFRATPSERLELLEWIGAICEELLRQHVKEYHRGD